MTPTSHAKIGNQRAQYKSRFRYGKGSLLKHDAGTLGDQNEIAETVHDHRAIALLDHIREHSERRRETRVAVGENVDVGALSPGDGGWCVDRRLDIRSIEVQRSGLGLEKRPPSGTLDKGLKKKERDIYGKPSTSHKIGNCAKKSHKTLAEVERWSRRSPCRRYGKY